MELNKSDVENQMGMLLQLNLSINKLSADFKSHRDVTQRFMDEHGAYSEMLREKLRARQEQLLLHTESVRTTAKWAPLAVLVTIVFGLVIFIVRNIPVLYKG